MNVKVTAEKMKIATESNSFSDLAEKLDITLATIDSWKRRNTIPNKYLLKVSEETGVSIDWLLNEDKPIFHISGGDRNLNKNSIIQDIKNYGNNAGINSGSMNSNTKQIDKDIFDDEILTILKSISPILENNKSKKDSFKKSLKLWLVENI